VHDPGVAERALRRFALFAAVAVCACSGARSGGPLGAPPAPGAAAAVSPAETAAGSATSIGAHATPGSVALEVRRGSAGHARHDSLVIEADGRARATEHDASGISVRETWLKPAALEQLRRRAEQTLFCELRPGPVPAGVASGATLDFRVALRGIACRVRVREDQLWHTTPERFWQLVSQIWTEIRLRTSTPLAPPDSPVVERTVLDAPPRGPVALKVSVEDDWAAIDEAQVLVVEASGRTRALLRRGVELLQADVTLPVERIERAAAAAAKAGVCEKRATGDLQRDVQRYHVEIALPGATCRTVLWDWQMWHQTGDFWTHVDSISKDARYTARPARLARPPR
jgi:hypothetical protein